MREKAMLTERTITEAVISKDELSKRASEALEGLKGVLAGDIDGVRIAQSPNELVSIEKTVNS